MTAMPTLRTRIETFRPDTKRRLFYVLGAAAYYVAMELSDLWTPDGSHQAILWLPVGVGFGLIVVGGRRLALVVALTGVVEGLSEEHGLAASLIVGLGLAAAALLMNEFVRRVRPRQGEAVVDTLARLVGASLAALLGSAATLAGLVVEGALPPDVGDFWLHVFLAQLAGITIAGPLVRTWLTKRSMGVSNWPETLAMLAVTGALTETVCSGTVARGGPVAYFVFAPVIWAALRMGRRGVSAACFLVALVAASNLTFGNGPFATSGVDPGVALDAFLIMLSVTGLILAGLEDARREGETELRRRKERFRALIENGNDVITVLAPDGAILYSSPSALSVLGYTPEELEGTGYSSQVHPDDRERGREAFAQMLEEGGGPVTVSTRYRHKDGRWIDVLATGRNLLHDPAVGGILVNSRDVTESREAQREREEAELRYRTLVERLPLVTYVNGTEPDEPPRYVSPQIETLLGYPVSDWSTDPLMSHRVIHPDDEALLDELIANEPEEDARRGEYRMVAADGRVVWVLDRMVTVRDERGEPVAVQGFLVDITEQKRLEEELRRAQRMEAIGLLAGGVAHDFNNLLTAISGYTELARAGSGDRESVLRDLDEVLHAADRASALTRQLLAFGRRRVLQYDVIDANAVVREAEQLLSRLIGEDIEVVTRLDPELGSVRADAWQLGQVLVNLAVNARDAMAGGGRLTIVTENETVVDEGGEVPPGEYVVLAVADTGTGIDPSVVDRLFEPFFTTKDVGEGTGLGLAMVYGIVQQSHGHVLVRSAPGEGAEFRVFLPRTHETADEQPAGEAGLAGGSETVLLVEDEDVVRRLTGEMLERQGYRVLAVGSPADALDVVEPYELLLTDVVMPGMSGPELADRLVARHPEAAVLFTSGYSGSAVAARDGLAGDLLEKPFTMEQLARKVREALDARRARADAA